MPTDGELLRSTNMMAAPIAPYCGACGKVAPWVEAGIGGAGGSLLMSKFVDARLLRKVPVDPATLPVWAAGLLEPALALVKAANVGRDVHEVLATRAGEELTHNKVIVTGATGAAGITVASVFLSRGIETWVIGRKQPDHPSAKRLADMGVNYRQIELSEERQGNQKAWMSYLARLAREMDVAMDDAVGGVRYLFDLAGNPTWVDMLGYLVGATGVIVDYAIPDSKRKQRAGIDGGEHIKQRTVNQSARVGSVNLDSAHDFDDAVNVLKWLVAHHRATLADTIHPIDGLDVKALQHAVDDPNIQKPMVFPQGKAAAGWQD